MGRPLRVEWTRDITVHAIEEKGGEEVSSKLEKQVGFNKYKDSNDVVIRLVDKAEFDEKKEEGTGYVNVEDIEKGETKSLFKLTKHQVACTDGSLYFIKPEVVIEDGVVTGIKLPEDSPVAIEGLDGGSDSSSDS